MVAIAQLVESRIVIPVVKGSSPFSHPILQSSFAGVAKLVDAPDLGSGALGVRVRVSSPAPPLNKQLLVAFFIPQRSRFFLTCRIVLTRTILQPAALKQEFRQIYFYIFICFYRFYKIQNSDLFKRIQLLTIDEMCDNNLSKLKYTGVIFFKTKYKDVIFFVYRKMKTS